MKVITSEDLARIEEYCEKATAGPWHEDGRNITCNESFHAHGHLRNRLGYSNASYANKVCEIYGNTIPPVDELDPIVPVFNRQFIVNARADLPILIADLREAQERIGKMRHALEKILPFLNDDWPLHISRESVASFTITEGYADAIEAVRDALKAGK